MLKGKGMSEEGLQQLHIGIIGLSTLILFSGEIILLCNYSVHRSTGMV